MSEKLPKAYEPAKYEDDIYAAWEDSGYFNPDNLPDSLVAEDAEAYTIVLPPPNITDKLHLGHSSMLAIEDLLIRYHRMKGYRALWIPGTDHAAIATQNVVEKKLMAEEKKSRHDLGREKFLEKVWEFLKETQTTILKQTRKMGASLDWSRTAFTLDEKRVAAVRKMFVEMHRAGVIYRGERIVNWCPRCHSTLAEDEVEHKEQKATLYTFRYADNFPFTIATTRPETKLGDTAVAVNPEDDRYQEFIGKEYEVDFVGVPLKIKIIADSGVDPEFGTGALGVTPAHSMADAKIAEENELESIKVIDESGKIMPDLGKYSGLEVNEAREKIVEVLRKEILLVKEEEVDNNLSVCYRCDTAIEPLPSKQWFISVDSAVEHLDGKSLKERAIEAAENAEIGFIPARFEKRYMHWMENLHDWCISRQIWFGHRIPVWYCTDCNEVIVSEKEPEKCPKCDFNILKQDPDSLDTWFSSGMWTFSTLGWPSSVKTTDGKPEKTGDLARFHPTQVLETGYEILTLWVSRMIMMSFFALGEVPFQEVYLHGMVLDKNGKKMSKSKGNGIDPIDMIDKFGTDAVRLSLLIGSTPGNDTRVFEEKIEGFRNFVNKLWNVSRFILSKVDNVENAGSSEIGSSMTLADAWILQTMRTLIEKVESDIKDYRFSDAGEALREFAKNDLADWYLEASKFEDSPAKDKILVNILCDLLKLLHPFIPFVTEAIWREMYPEKMLLVEKWPDVKKYTQAVSLNEAEAQRFTLVREMISAIRTARADHKVEPSRKIEAVVYAGKQADLLIDSSDLIKKMRTGLDKLEIRESGEKPESAIFVKCSGLEIYLIGAVDAEKERVRIEKEIANLEKMIGIGEKKLANTGFRAGAPKEVVECEQEKLDARKKDLEQFRGQLNSL